MIHIKPAAVKGTKWYEHLLRFVFGGVCTVGAGLIADKWGPVVGGLFLAFPAIFPAGISMIVGHEKEKKQKAGMDGRMRGRIAAGVDAEGSALGAVALAGFGLVIWKWLPRAGTVGVIATAAGVWVIGAMLLWRIYRVEWLARLRRLRRT